MKRKALLGPGNLSTATNMQENANMLGNNAASGASIEARNSNTVGVGIAGAAAFGLTHGGDDAMANVVSGMAANKACFAERTPITHRAHLSPPLR